MAEVEEETIGEDVAPLSILGKETCTTVLNTTFAHIDAAFSSIEWALSQLKAAITFGSKNQRNEDEQEAISSNLSFKQRAMCLNRLSWLASALCPLARSRLSASASSIYIKILTRMYKVILLFR